MEVPGKRFAKQLHDKISLTKQQIELTKNIVFTPKNLHFVYNCVF